VADDDAQGSIEDLAQGCVRFVKEAVGMELDFTGDTLPVLDHYVRTLVDTPSEEVVALLAPAAGAYFGEVVRRTFGAVHWEPAGEDHRAYRLVFEPFVLSFNPIGTAVEVLTHAEAEGWNAHYQLPESARPLVEQSLKSTAPVDERDYFTFTVRFEALQQVADLLSALEEHKKKKKSLN